MADEENKKPEVLEPLEPKENESEVLEFEFNEDGEEDLKKTIKKLRADLKACKAENYELNATKIEYLTGWQKERADFANYKKQEDDRRLKILNSENKTISEIAQILMRQPSAIRSRLKNLV